MADGHDAWHRPLRHVPAADASADTGQTPGVARREGVSARTVGSERVWKGSTAVAPHTPSVGVVARSSEEAIVVNLPGPLT